MNDEEQVPQARTPAADAGETPAERLKALGVRGILWQLARDGQIIDVRCEMPQCYCPRGRRDFERRSTRSTWQPTADHYPKLKMHGGQLTRDNVRLAHRLCNQRDYVWRMKINAMLGERMSLEEIAEKLNVEEGSNDSRHEQMDSCICSEGIRFLEAPWRAMNKSPQKPTREATGGRRSAPREGSPTQSRPSAG